MHLRIDKSRVNGEGLNDAERLARLETRVLGHGRAPGLEARVEDALGDVAELKLRIEQLEQPWYLRLFLGKPAPCAPWKERKRG